MHPIYSGVPQRIALGPLLYLMYTADLPTTSVATYPEDTVVLASHITPASASRNLQINLKKVQQWLRKWRIKVNETKSHCQILQAEDAKYLGIY